MIKKLFLKNLYSIEGDYSIEHLDEEAISIGSGRNKVYEIKNNKTNEILAMKEFYISNESG